MSIRCSQLNQLLKCPGSLTLIERVAEEESGATAWEGNWCHHDAAKKLIEEHGAFGPEGGLPEPEIPGDWQPNEWSHWLVRYYLEVILEWTDYDQAFLVEQELIEDFERFRLTGHVDLFAINPDATEATGFDLKTGNIPVTAAELNNQVLGYIVLMRATYPTLRKITFCLVQPRNNPDDGNERVTEITVEGDDLDATRAYLEERINAALDHPNKLVSGIAQCRYCPAVLQCPAIKEDIRMAEVEMTKEQLEAMGAHPSAEDLARFERAKKLLSPVFDKAHDLFKEQLNDLGELRLEDGSRFFIKERAGRRTIKDNAVARAALSDLPDELYDQCVSFKPSDIERALAQHLEIPQNSKKDHDAKDEYAERLGGVTAQPKQKILNYEEPS